MASFTVTYMLSTDAAGNSLPHSLTRRIKYDHCPVIPRVGEIVREPSWERSGEYDASHENEDRTLVVKRITHHPEADPDTTRVILGFPKDHADKSGNWSFRFMRLLQLVFFLIGAGLIGKYVGMPVWQAALSIFLIWTAIAMEKPLREARG